MADKDNTPYEQLLEELNNVKSENATLRKEFNELRDFNRALLSKRNLAPANNTDSKEKFRKFLEGE